MPAPLFHTAQMVMAMPYDDGNRYETVHGELLVTPSPRELHQRVQMRLLMKLGNYLAEQRVGQLYAAPADISWGPDILVQPDLFVVTLEAARTGLWSEMQKLLLTVEVLSPSTTRQDRFTKRRLYQEVGIPLAWFVDCDACHIEVWTPTAKFPVFDRQRVQWQPVGAATPLTIDVQILFRPV